MTKAFALAACLALGISVLTGCSGGSNSIQIIQVYRLPLRILIIKVFNYGVTAYSGAQANGGIDPHLSYAGWNYSTLRCWRMPGKNQ